MPVLIMTYDMFKIYVQLLTAFVCLVNFEIRKTDEAFSLLILQKTNKYRDFFAGIPVHVHSSQRSVWTGMSLSSYVKMNAAVTGCVSKCVMANTQKFSCLKEAS